MVVAALTVICFKVKNSYLRNWIVAVGSSVLFMLCHISGFASFSVGEVFGLLDIFGSALVMCYLTINLSFWLSVLLHVVNNSLAIILPMFFMGDAIHLSYPHFSVDAEPLKPLQHHPIDSSYPYIEWAPQSSYSFPGCELPAFAARMLNDVTSVDTVFLSKGHPSSLESRYDVTVTLKDDTVPFNVAAAMRMVMKEWGLTADTTLQTIYRIWVTDTAGFSGWLEDYDDAIRVFVSLKEGTMEENLQAKTKYVCTCDSLGMYYWCLNPPEKNSSKLAAFLDKLNGYSVEYRPEREVSVVTVCYKD